MQVGINEQPDQKEINYYEFNYDILRTPDFSNSFRLLKPQHSKKVIGTAKNKKCRFCGKSESEVSFRKDAHIFPESIGNNDFLSNYECDICNQFFGNNLENDYANFFNLYHSLMQLKGKDGIPKCRFKIPCPLRSSTCADYCINIFPCGDIPIIQKCKHVDESYINLSNNSLIISKPVGKCCPIAVYKTLVKMAITVMPVEELSLFTNTIDWIRSSEHSNFYTNKKLLIRYKMIPGFNVIEYPCYHLFRRKKTIWNKPYMLFNITYGCLSLLIEVPRLSDTCPNHEFETMPFPPIPFHSSTEGIWDMSNLEFPKNMRHSINLNFNEKKECTEQIKVTTEKGKTKFHYEQDA